MDAINWIYRSTATSGLGPLKNDPREWAGSVYSGLVSNQDSSKFFASYPNPSVKGKNSESNPSYPPSGYAEDAVAFYHTHGQCTSKDTEDDFSRGQPSDVWQADFREVPSYLGTPGSMIKIYVPDPTLSGNGPVTTLQNGTCCPGPSH